MNRDNFSSLITGIGVIALIIGFGVYFNIQESNLDDMPLEFKSNLTEIDKLQFKKAKDFTGITGYLNTEPIALSDLENKVILIDFWTYSCINCIRTIPYLNSWYEKYNDLGLEIIGIHTPEFEFEKDIKNVEGAIERFDIEYLVLQDNNKETWNEYDNRYWPRKYLIDHEGYLRYNHIGEGAYNETEGVIQSLLKERSVNLGLLDTKLYSNNVTNGIPKLDKIHDVDFSQIKTPELYFGYDFTRSSLGNAEGFQKDEIVSYIINKSKVKPNMIYLDGRWKNNPDHMELQSDTGKIVLLYSAKAVNIVAGGIGNGTVIQDKKSIISEISGNGITENGYFDIDRQQLYNLIINEEYGDHLLEINVSGKGFKIYTFTFG
ncbi:MAG: redoxin domain-containing protein [Nitrososphaeraceae archaeon]